MTSSTIPSYLILGSGAFGASTALHLIRAQPSASVTLLDRDHYASPTRVAASWDWNKVVRADYADVLYARLMLEAQALWRSDPTFAPFYHRSGVVWISASGFAREALRSYAELGVEPDVSVYGVDEARGLCGGLFEGGDYAGVKEVLLNRDSGWAEAKEVLARTIEAAVVLGVRYLVGEVARLRLDEDGDGNRRRCCGVVTADGTEIDAERVVLCTGAYTPKLLVDSAPEWPDLHAGDRILALGVTEATVPLSAEERAILDTMPVGINDNPVERGEDVGCLPLPSLNSFKCWGQLFYRNTIVHPVTRQSLSAPPQQDDYAQWEVSSILQDDVRWALRSLFGEIKAKSLRLENCRICWDAWTATEDFIVSPHTACDGLYIATCGSFHGFKFLPIIGKYVVQMLEGKLDPELQVRWAWDRERPPMESKNKWVHGELRDFLAE